MNQQIAYRENGVMVSFCEGKMLHIPSINSNGLENVFCNKMRKNCKSICVKCYHFTSISYRKNMRIAYTENDRILATSILPINKLPVLNYGIFRFNSHGEIHNKNHFINYCNIAKYNKHCTFTLWTKRKNIVAKYHEYIPKNMILVYSSINVNKQEKLPLYFNKVFTTYNAEYIKSNNIDINCKLQCYTCKKCYNTKNKTVFINEVLKSDRNKI